MPTTGVSLSEELLEAFDAKITEMKAEGELDHATSRSEVMRRLIREWVEEREDVPPPEPDDG